MLFTISLEKEMSQKVDFESLDTDTRACIPPSLIPAFQVLRLKRTQLPKN
jgi:hypothetical protein